MIDFLKMHGTGNDFVVIPDLENRIDISSEAVRALSQPHFGIGGDGVIRITRPAGKSSGFFMDYRNNDGTVAEMCGNGVRVVGKWLGDHGFADSSVNLETRSGTKKLVFERGANDRVESVTVDMGAPIGEVTRSALDYQSRGYAYTSVSMGNPHAVVFVDDVDAAPVAGIGKSLELSTEGGTNVEFVDQRDGRLRQRTWERSVGETLACGTGACAVTVAAMKNNMIDKSVDIELRGGILHMEWKGGNSPVMMTGPATEVFSGSFDETRFGITVG